MTMQREVVKMFFLYCCLIHLNAAAIVPCTNNEAEAFYHGRKHWSIPEASSVFNNSDFSSCSVLCREDNTCKSFAVSDTTCSLYTIEIGTKTYKLFPDKSSVHFDGHRGQSHSRSVIGRCSRSHDCANGATCINDCSERGYACICANRFRGVNCEDAITDTFVLEATIPVSYPTNIDHFESNGNHYVVAPSYNPNGVFIFKYVVSTTEHTELQFIEEIKMFRARVYKMDNEIYLSLGKFQSTDPMDTYRFNPVTEQFEDPFTVYCPQCDSSFLQTSDGRGFLFVGRAKSSSSAKTTSSNIYSFSNTKSISSIFSQTMTTYGIFASHMVEIDGANFLVQGNSKDSSGVQKNVVILRQPYNYDKVKTASVLAIFIRNEECFENSKGTDYRGIVSTTETGVVCQKWSVQEPHTHDFYPEVYKDSGLGDHNFCRNPDNVERPWCFTTGTARWDYCNVGHPSNCSKPTWKLVFKAVAGVNNVNLFTLWSTEGSRNEDKNDAMRLDGSFRDHYKSSLVDTWDHVAKVKFSFYDNKKSKLALIFDAAGATKLNWFTKERLLNYPWTDLRSKTPHTFRMADDSRPWLILESWNSCRNDLLWLAVTTAEGCEYEVAEPRPVFMYSDQKTSRTFHNKVMINCYFDNGVEKSLSDYILTSPGVTAWDCLHLCRGMEYKYAGVDIKNTACYCGDSGYSSGGSTNCHGHTDTDVTLMMTTEHSWYYLQEFDVVNEPRWIDTMKHNGHIFLFIQDVINSVERPRLTHIYKWSKSTKTFEPHQTIDRPYRHYGSKVLEVYGQPYLILTPYNADTGFTDGYRVKVAFYRLEGTYFVEHFERTTCRSYGWSAFVEDNDLYTLESNHYGDPCDTSNTGGTIKVYKWT